MEDSWCSAYLDASHDTEQAEREIALRWRAAREDLTEQGADARTLEAMDRAVTDHPRLTGQGGLAVFGSAGAVPLTVPLPSAPLVPTARVDLLPDTMPLVKQRGEHVSWLRVIVDHTGADLEGATAGGISRHREVVGEFTYPIRKVKPGGWSAPRYQRAAETNWERNATQVATGVAELAEAVGAEVIVVGGDPHARPLLVEHLPARWRDRVVLTDTGSRAAGADPEALDEATVVAIAERAEQHVRVALDRYESELGRGAAASTGLAGTVAALRRGQIDTEFVAFDVNAGAEIWIGPQPTDTALSADELRAAGVSDPQRVRADAAILRGLAATDAQLLLVDSREADLDDGLGALLRYDDPATVKGSW